jgi:transketolase
MTSNGRSSHVASALSVADILAVLYAGVLNIDPSNPTMPDRDRLILSKGHAGAAVYAVLAEVGFFPVAELMTHYTDGSKLSGHVSHLGVPGVELSTGSLGHGLSVGAGMALQSKRRGGMFRTYVVLSDGECDEGSVWEAAMFAGHHRLEHLVAVIDYNKLQSLTTTTATLDLEPFADKWRAFGWSVDEVDGHDHSELGRVLSPVVPVRDRRPRCVIAHTTKGRGVSFMENEVLWHYRPPDADDLLRALAELEPTIDTRP